MTNRRVHLFQARLPYLFAACLVLTACKEEARPGGAAHLEMAPATAAGTVRTSELVAGPDIMNVPMDNAWRENPYVLAEGKRLYQQFNCAGCHGLNGGGGMGPPFADGDWIYGSSPAVVYQSIVQGRPEGMPAFTRLSPDITWKIVAYVRSLDPDVGTESGAQAGPAGDGPTGAGSGEDR
jgi:cytochrome c oxidase cbb3-type subunit III